MPDSTPPATKTDESPPRGEDGWRPDLGALRARLDEIDDKIHDLLIERARVVEGVARSGKTAAFRPGREASILRRLLARHQGKLPAQTLVRMWREMLAGTTAMQTPISVAVVRSEHQIAEIAREHFGFLTPVDEYTSIEGALSAVREGRNTVAVLAFPDQSQPWWPGLTNLTPQLHIVARLPFWSGRPGGVPSADALVIATTPPDASGADRSFLAHPSGPDDAHLVASGLVRIATHGAISEVQDLVTQGDPRLPAETIVLGGYAIPVGTSL